MNYLEFRIETENAVVTDIITALLGDLGFESFTEDSNCLLAYIQENPEKNNNNVMQEVIDCIREMNLKNAISYKVIEQQNWNATWEKSFEPIVVAEKCIIRAPFHNPQENILNIIIEPKMSFGTGHHQTTFLMLQMLFELELKNKTVLDMGCGTAVLAILAEKLQARTIMAIDIEEWAYENALENVTLNKCKHIEVIKGSAEKIGKFTFDVIIANINKNVLMQDLPIYAEALNKNGKLLLSGFFTTDAESLINRAKESMLIYQTTKAKEEWAMLMFEKM